MVLVRPLSATKPAPPRKSTTTPAATSKVVVPLPASEPIGPLSTGSVWGGDRSNRLAVSTGGVVAVLVLLGVAGASFRDLWATSPRPPQVSSSPLPPAPLPANDDVRAIRQSVERQERVAEDERRDKARKEAIEKKLKALDDLGRWNTEQHNRIKAQDKLLRQ